MEEIAAGACVAVGTLYRHYPSKADLVAAVIEHSVGHVAELALATDTAIAGGADVEQQLGELLRNLANRAAESRALREAALSLGVPNSLRSDGEVPPPGSPMSTVLQALDRIVAAAAAAGVVRKDATRRDIAVLLRGVLDFELDEPARERYVQIILKGLRPAAA